MNQLAFDNFYLAAEQGNIEARVKIGDYLYYGLGVEKELEKAADQYHIAERSGSSQAAFNVAYMYENGLGVPSDYHLAKRYYERSFELSGDAVLAVSLALLKLSIVLQLEHFHHAWSGLSFFVENTDMILISVLALALTCAVYYRQLHNVARAG